jgi:hypothetical protein
MIGFSGSLRSLHSRLRRGEGPEAFEVCTVSRSRVQSTSAVGAQAVDT